MTLLNAGGFHGNRHVVPSGSIPEIFGAGGQVRKIQDGCSAIRGPRRETRQITDAPYIAAPRLAQYARGKSSTRSSGFTTTHPRTQASCTLRFHCRLRLT